MQPSYISISLEGNERVKLKDLNPFLQLCDSLDVLLEIYT